MENAALLMIDMQNGFLCERSPLFIDGAPATVPACAEVIRFCREQGIPVVFVTRSYATDGSNVERPRYAAWLRGGRPISPGCDPDISDAMPEAFGAADTDYHIIKPRFSAFFHTELDALLRSLGVTRVVLAGTTTPNCIRTTCYDAISLDYDVTVLSDCTSSKTPEIQRANLRDMQNLGAMIMTADAFQTAVRSEAEGLQSIDHLAEQIMRDCRVLGTSEEACVSFLRCCVTTVPQYGKSDGWFFYHDPKVGYALEQWERGTDTWGIHAADSLEFRVLFQCEILLDNHSSSDYSNVFLKAASKLFGKTEAFRLASERDLGQKRI